MPVGMEVGLSPGDLVLDRDRAPSPKRGQSPIPNFRPMSIVAKRLNESRWHLARSGPWSRPQSARWGPSTPTQKTGQSPQFSAHLYCGQTAARIKMPLGMEVGLSPGDFVLDGDPAHSSPKWGGPNFQPTSIVAKRLHGSRCHLVQRCDTVLDGDPAPPPLKGHSPPIFGQCPLWPNSWMN